MSKHYIIEKFDSDYFWVHNDSILLLVLKGKHIVK